MRSAQTVQSLEKRTEESMSPRDWAILLADRVAACGTLDEYCAAQAEAPAWSSSPHFQPLVVYHRLRLLRETDALRAAELEYRVLCQLMLRVNVVLYEAAGSARMWYGLAASLGALIPLCPPSETGNTEEPSEGSCAGRTMDLPELAQLVACHLATVRCHLEAMQLLSRDRLCGRPFVVRSSLQSLRDTEMRYDRLLAGIRASRAAAGEQLPEEVRPTPGSVRALADLWLHEAETAVLQQFEPDARRDWQDFVSAARGRAAITIEF